MTSISGISVGNVPPGSILISDSDGKPLWLLPSDKGEREDSIPEYGAEAPFNYDAWEAKNAKE